MLSVPSYLTTLISVEMRALLVFDRLLSSGLLSTEAKASLAYLRTSVTSTGVHMMAGGEVSINQLDM